MAVVTGQISKRRFALVVAVAACGLHAIGDKASANVYFWPGGGGNWSTANAWRDSAVGGPAVTWSSGSEAVFAGSSGGTVNVDLTTDVKQLRFDTGGYSLPGVTSTRTLNLKKDQGSGWVTFRLDSTNNQAVTIGGAVAVNIDGENTTEAHTFFVGAGDSATFLNTLTDLRLVKDGTGVLRLSGSNSYTGTTIVNAGTLLVNGTHANNASGAYSFATTTTSGHATLGGTGSVVRAVTAAGTNTTNRAVIAPGDPSTASGVGTLTIGSSANTKLTTFGNNSRLAIDIDGASADRLTLEGGITLSSTASDEILFNVVNTPTLGKYTVVSYTGARTDSGTQGFTTATAVPAGYRLSYSNFNATNGTIDLIQRAVIEPTALNATVITGGTVGINVTVKNDAENLGDSLNQFTATGSGSGVSGSFNGGPLAPQASTSNNSAITFNSTGQSLGVNSRSVSVSSTDAGVTTPVATNFNVNVLDHADASFDAPANAKQSLLEVEFNLVQGQSDSQSFTLSNRDSAATRADLLFTSIVESGYETDGANAGAFESTMAAFAALAEGGTTGSFDVSVDSTTLPVGTHVVTYTINLTDDTAFQGALAQSLTIEITANITAIPEPGSIGIAALTGLALGARRRRRVR